MRSITLIRSSNQLNTDGFKRDNAWGISDAGIPDWKSNQSINF